MGWQPIGTAPRDGTPIDVWWSGGDPAAPLPLDAAHRRLLSRWGREAFSDPNSKEGWLLGVGFPPPYYVPTHWMPLPDPPMTDSPPAGEVL